MVDISSRVHHRVHEDVHRNQMEDEHKGESPVVLVVVHMHKPTSFLLFDNIPPGGILGI